MRDVVVVGGGVLGMAVALGAADAGLRVTLVSPGCRTEGAASAAAGAMLGVLGEHTAEDTDPADLEFRFASAEMWPGWLAGLAEHTPSPVVLRRGTVVIANLDHPGDQDNLDAIERAAGHLGLRAQRLDPRHVPGLRPAPRHAPVAALACPDEGWVDADALLDALESASARHPRITTVPDTVRRVTVSPDGSRVTGVRLGAGGELPAAQVVLCAGAATGALLDGLTPPTLPAVLPAKGVSMLLDVPVAEQPPMVIRTPNRDFACGLHLVPRAACGLYLGATNRPGPAGGATTDEHLSLLHGLLHQFRTDLRTTAVREIRWGHRPATGDGKALLGPVGPEGLHLATGTYRNGVLMAPAVAAIVTAGLLDEPCPVPHPYAPSRPRLQPSADLLTHLLATGAEHMTSVFLDPGGTLPFDRQGQLASTLAALVNLALHPKPDAQTDELRENLRARVNDRPTLEGVCDLFNTLKP
ncbi:MAG: FAD-dependent oxidoreductase [Streptomyces sp.]|uniref:NAD(P)/FAD-dependent oxidoreductase n=1 Tax=Streptomyces sp. TaxID=1931 RepID=UPI0025D06870|nr:FAD-dependent oxidoreductase [Streptomyces sp.]MBW8794657.1 FAD-dependent oxidoreductase [Streptomyces sp.]